ncbi:MAG: glucose-1-phosphate adenylyltransferase, partial [Calditrichota bacterium]
PRHLPGSLLDHAQVETSIICDGCIIKNASISNSIIGIRSIVAEGSRIKSTLMMGADFYEGEGYYPDLTNAQTPPIGVGPGCSIEKAIIDKNARLGAGVIIRPKDPADNHDGEGYAVRDGITIIQKNAVIPEGTVI